MNEDRKAGDEEAKGIKELDIQWWQSQCLRAAALVTLQAAQEEAQHHYERCTKNREEATRQEMYARIQWERLAKLADAIETFTREDDDDGEPPL